MPMSLLETSIYVHPGFPVEFVIRVEGAPIRVSIEWEAIRQLVGPASRDVEQVRNFLHRRRAEIAAAVRAQLAARGTPLTRQLNMSSRDLRLVETPGRQSVDHAANTATARIGTEASVPVAGNASVPKAAGVAQPGKR